MITEEQLTQVQDFCSDALMKNCGKVFYDIEIELTDHITEWVEEEMRNKRISFEQALEGLQKAFPASDFSALVVSRKKTLAAGLMKECLTYFLSYFSWPKIAVLFLGIAGVMMIDSYGKIDKFPQIGLHVLNIINFSFLMRRNNIIYYNRTDLRVKLLSFSIARTFGFYLILPMLMYLLLSLSSVLELFRLQLAFWRIALYAFPVLIIYCLAIKEATIRMHEKIRSDYPGAFAG